MSRLKDPAAVRKIARKSLFEALDGICEGAIIVDRDARIIWLSDKYAARLKLASAQAGIGRVVEDVIPNSLMREVVRTGEPILLDIMQFGDESFVVMRVPVKDERGRVIGAAGFMLFDRLQDLQPLVAKVERLRSELADTRKSLAAERRAQLLSVDQAQLRELLGEAELRELLDPDALAELELRLQGLDPTRPLRKRARRVLALFGTYHQLAPRELAHARSRLESLFGRGTLAAH